MRNIILIITAFVSLTLLTQCQAKTTVYIHVADKDNETLIFAASELSAYLSRIYPSYQFEQSDNKSGELCIKLLSHTNVNRPKGSYSVLSNETSVSIVGNGDIGVLYGVYGLLEKLGCGFFMSYETMPVPKEQIDFDSWNLQNQPLVDKRIIFNWHNFISGCTGWDYEDWKKWTLQSVKMGYNTIMVHAYGNNPMGKFDYNGIDKTYGYLASSIKGRDWGAQHVNDVRRIVGGELFTDYAFGSQAALVPDEQRMEAARTLMSDVFTNARMLGMNVIYATDIDTHEANPQEIIQTLPKHALLVTKSGSFLANPETDEGYAYYKEQVKDLLELYPQITNLALWKRGTWLATAVKELEYKYFPKIWKIEYDNIVFNHPELTDDPYARATFVHAKMIKAMSKAARELNPDIEVSCGSWTFQFINSANIMLPADVSLLPLDHKHHFTQKYATKLFSDVSKKRKITPIIWAHHDDHRYMGKPYTPYSNFYTELQKNGADGFAVIHWKTRPLDLFFTSIGRQVWKNTENEDLQSTIAFYNDRVFGVRNHDALNNYIYRWLTEAPMFGRETLDHLFDYGKFVVGEGWGGKPEQFVQGIDERLAILDSVNTDDLSDIGCSMYQFYKLKEEFYRGIITNQEKMTAAQLHIKAEHYDSAKVVVEQIHTIPTLDIYSKHINSIPATKGEQASLISMNLRWTPDLIELHQQTGMEAIRINFQETSHDSLASAPGNYTYFIDDEGKYWYGLGSKELKDSNIYNSKEVLSSVSDSYLHLEEDLRIPVKIREYDIPKGSYQLVVYSELRSKKKIGIDIYSDKKLVSNKQLELIDGEGSIELEMNQSFNTMRISTSVPIKIYGLELKPTEK